MAIYWSSSRNNNKILFDAGSTFVMKRLSGLLLASVYSFNLVAEPAPAPAETSVSNDVYSILGLSEDTVPFPVDQVFFPLLADPKQPQFFVSYRSYDTPVDKVTIASVGYGETFGLYRQAGKQAGDGLQISLAGGLFAQFNLDAESSDLINADYTIGVPISYRRGNHSLRLRLYHQSSHLGDEFLLNVKPDRINLSFESLELLYSHDWQPWRVYIGGEYLVHREPADLDPAGLHAGIEYHPKRQLEHYGKWVGGIDLKSWEEHGWDTDISFKAGYEFNASNVARRRLRVMLEAYDGHSPHGQFYNTEITYYGMGIYLGF